MEEKEIDWDFLREVYAKDCNENEFRIFRHLAETYGLDPVSKEIWCIKAKNQPARIFVSRDGHLAIAHRSGHWGSIKTVFDWGSTPQYIEVTDKWTGKVTRVLVPFSATVIIYRNDSQNPTEHTVFWDEYGGSTGLWASKPKTMLQKVAECQGLRRAYNMHGFYSREEFQDEMEEEDQVGIPPKDSPAKAGDSLPPQTCSSNPPAGKESQSPLPEEEIDWSATRKTKPEVNDYDERQKLIAEKNYDDYGLDKSIFEKAKIGSTGFWDRGLINRDYIKQLDERGYR